MPPVACGDQHRVNVVASGQELPQVAVHFAVFISVPGVYVVAYPHSLGFLDVAYRDELHVFLANRPSQILHPAIANANGAQHDPLARRRLVRTAKRF